MFPKVLRFAADLIIGITVKPFPSLPTLLLLLLLMLSPQSDIVFGGPTDTKQHELILPKSGYIKMKDVEHWLKVAYTNLQLLETVFNQAFSEDDMPFVAENLPELLDERSNLWKIYNDILYQINETKIVKRYFSSEPKMDKILSKKIHELTKDFSNLFWSLEKKFPEYLKRFECMKEQQKESLKKQNEIEKLKRKLKKSDQTEAERNRLENELHARESELQRIKDETAEKERIQCERERALLLKIENAKKERLLLAEQIARMREAKGEEQSQPEEEQSQPEDEQSQPEKEQSQPEEEQSQPEEEQSQPEKEQSQPEDEQSQPEKEQSQPEDEQSQPEKEQPQPEKEQSQPEKEQSQPEKEQSRPEEEQSQPEEEQSQPEDEQRLQSSEQVSESKIRAQTAELATIDSDGINHIVAKAEGVTAESEILPIPELVAETQNADPHQMETIIIATEIDFETTKTATDITSIFATNKTRSMKISRSQFKIALASLIGTIGFGFFLVLSSSSNSSFRSSLQAPKSKNDIDNGDYYVTLIRTFISKLPIISSFSSSASSIESWWWWPSVAMILLLPFLIVFVAIYCCYCRRKNRGKKVRKFDGVRNRRKRMLSKTRFASAFATSAMATSISTPTSDIQTEQFNHSPNSAIQIDSSKSSKSRASSPAASQARSGIDSTDTDNNQNMLATASRRQKSAKISRSTSGNSSSDHKDRKKGKPKLMSGIMAEAPPPPKPQTKPLGQQSTADIMSSIVQSCVFTSSSSASSSAPSSSSSSVIDAKQSSIVAQSSYGGRSSLSKMNEPISATSSSSISQANLSSAASRSAISEMPTCYDANSIMKNVSVPLPPLLPNSSAKIKMTTKENNNNNMNKKVSPSPIPPPPPPSPPPPKHQKQPQQLQQQKQRIKSRNKIQALKSNNKMIVTGWASVIPDLPTTETTKTSQQVASSPNDRKISHRKAKDRGGEEASSSSSSVLLFKVSSALDSPIPALKNLLVPVSKNRAQKDSPAKR